jgi:hypothetical protein
MHKVFGERCPVLASPGRAYSGWETVQSIAGLSDTDHPGNRTKEHG